MLNKRIIAVAAGMLISKKEKQEIYNNLYLNYGLLGLCTNISSKYDVEMYQGDYDSPQKIIDISHINDTTSPIILLSVPSFLSLLWAVEFAKKVKTLCPDAYIICGGRWVMDNNLGFVKSKFNDTVDFYSLGCPDDNIIDIIEGKGMIDKKYKYSSTFSRLDYSLLYNYNKYQPVIEVSRGCGSGCLFCLESKFKVCAIKTPCEIFKEIDEIINLYGDEKLNFYFEASIFQPTVKWCEEFSHIYNSRNYKFQWRCTTRVDRNLDKQLCILASAGLKVVDYGLESGSAIQLSRMGKTVNSYEYLKKASGLLKVTSECGIWNKCNIMLYAGETDETFEETRSFLKKHQQYIKGISANPLTIYLNGIESTNEYIKEIEKISECTIENKKLYDKGYTYINLSSSVSKERAFEMCRELETEFMSEKDYIDLKNICYINKFFINN